MDTGTTIMGVCIIVMVILPFILIGRGKKNADRQLIGKIDAQAHELQSQITDYGLAPNLAIGLDANKGELFYYKKSGDDIHTANLKLIDFSDCKLQINTRKVKMKGTVSIVTDKIDFVLHERISGKTRTLNLYDAEETFDLTKELQLGREWEQIIQQKIISLAQNRKAV